MKTNTIKAFTLGFVILLLSLSAAIWAADVTPSVTLTSYYSAANGKKADALRTALQGIIDNHTVVSYGDLGILMQYSDTEEADGVNVVDMYTSCTYTASGKLTWISSGDVGDGLNREHTAPQSWFNEASPMVSDAFHIFPTDAKANNNRSSYLYGEIASGVETRSYSTSKCVETGKLRKTSGANSIASYTYNGTTYSPTATYTGQVYEPADEYKGDIARGYFYLATRYADKCSSWSGGAFGSDNNGFKNYTAELMLKWHRQDPVSRKELIRNEAIYGNTKYNKSSKKQGNRNPFIDYPELVEYIWGSKKDQNVTISNLTSGYAEAGTGTPTTTYNVTLYRMGVPQVLTGKSGTFVLPTKATEANACGDWTFAGWVTTAVSTATTTKPTFVTQVTSASTLYAVYSKTESSGSAPHRAKAAASSDAYTFTSSSWAATLNGSSANWTSGKAGAGYMNSGVQVTSGASGANATCPTSYSNISSIVVSYCTNANKGAGSIMMTVDGNEVSQSVSTSGGTSARDLTFDFSSSTPTGAPKITVTCTTNSIYVCGVTINYGSGSSTTTTYDSDPDDCHCSGKQTKPSVTATPGDGKIILTWQDVTGVSSYTVTIGKGVGYTTECSDPEIGTVTHSGTTNTCVITGLVNGLEYTTSVVSDASATTCDSDPAEQTTTPDDEPQAAITVSDVQELADLPVNENTELTVTGSGYLTVSSPVTINSLTLYYGEDGHAQVSGISNLKTEKLDVVLQLPAAKDGAEYKWFAIAVPFDVNVASGIFANGSTTPSRQGYDFYIDEFDGNLRATEQQGWKRVGENAVLHPGKMYMIYCSASAAWRFSAAQPAAITEAQKTNVSEFASTLTTDGRHAGWNGIANTLFTNAEGSTDDTQLVTVYNNTLGVYEPVTVSRHTFAAAAPFFVQVASDGEFDFSNPAASPVARRVQLSEQSGYSTLTLSNEADTYSARVFLAVSEDKQDHYTIGRDLQHISASAPAVPQLWFNAYDMQLAAYEALLESERTIPVGLYAPAEGTYTLAMTDLPTTLAATLVKNGQPVWDLSVSAADINLSQGNNDGYGLYIRRVKDVTTGISTGTSAAVQKVLIGDRLLIIRDGKAFTVTGICLP